MQEKPSACCHVNKQKADSPSPLRHFVPAHDLRKVKQTTDFGGSIGRDFLVLQWRFCAVVQGSDELSRQLYSRLIVLSF